MTDQINPETLMTRLIRETQPVRRATEFTPLEVIPAPQGAFTAAAEAMAIHIPPTPHLPTFEEENEESKVAEVTPAVTPSLSDFSVFKLATDYRFHFILLGVGGTGSELLPKLCRKLSTLRNVFGECLHDLSAVDNDVVEEKNLERQNFFKSDLGKNKAETLAVKCSTLFGLNIKVYKEYVETKERLLDIVRSSDKVPFIIGCVDTAAVRKLIHECVQPDGYLSNLMPIFYLDSGNEEFNGQVVLGSYLAGRDSHIHRSSNNTYTFNSPTVCDHYPEMLETAEKFTTALSCADMAVSNPQAAETNVEAATILFQFICNALRGAVEYHKVTFNVPTGNRHVTYNYKNILEGYGIDFTHLQNSDKAKDPAQELYTVGHEPVPMHILTPEVVEEATPAEI